jgi:predicted phosphodiesterase
MQSKNDIAAEYLRRFPDSATKTLARLCYNENIEVWPTLEACRSTFRYMRGNMGKNNRRKRRDTTHDRPNGKAGQAFGAIPEGMTEIDDFAPHVIEKPGRYLILSDIHVPYHDRDSLLLALEREKDLAGIILNGDIMDCFALSKWEKDPRERDFPYELETTKTVLGAIREAFPKASLTYKIGNHEERYERYMQLKAPELLGVAAFEIQNLLESDSFQMEIVRDKRPIRLGKLLIIHAHEYRSGFINPVNPARGLFLRAKTTALGSHYHQTSQHSENTLDDRHMSCWSTGCLCDLHPRYAVLNKWNHGFATVTIDETGAFSVNNMRIIDGKIWE